MAKSRRVVWGILPLAALMSACSYSTNWEHSQREVGAFAVAQSVHEPGEMIHLSVDLGRFDGNPEIRAQFIAGLDSTLASHGYRIAITSRDEAADLFLKFMEMEGGSDYTAPSAGFILTLGLIPEKIKYSYTFVMSLSSADPDHPPHTLRAECHRTLVRHLLLFPWGLGLGPDNSLGYCHGVAIGEQLATIL